MPVKRESARARTANDKKAAAKSVAAKAHVKPGARVALINPHRDIVATLGLPQDAKFVAPSSADLVFLFADTRAKLASDMKAAVKTLGPDAALWVFFRKGSKGAGLDMNRDDVWAAAEALGLRPIGLVSVDETWSVFRLRTARRT
jgi:hypothetical protein